MEHILRFNESLDNQSDSSMIHEIIKKEIKDIVKNHIDNCIAYEWNGSNFNEMLLSHCFDRDNKLFNDVELKEKKPTIQFDKELYKKFLDHLTEYVHSGLSVTKNGESVTD